MSGIERRPRSALVVQHFASGGLGNLEPVLSDRGYRVTTVQASADTLRDLDPHEHDLLIVLGSTDGVYEELDYMAPEIELVRRRLAAAQPTLGICFGAQVMASALGKPVVSGHADEIGYRRIQPTEAGLSSPIRHFAQIPVAQWHGDTFELPDDVTLLASSEHYENQAFAIGSHALAVQFHPELTPEMHETWMGENQDELRRNSLTDAAMHAEREAHAPAAQHASRAMFAEWLDGLS
ncbi:MAG: glutamine amidotransferase [Mycetocola sp.]